MSDWQVDYYSRPVLEPDGRKRWELLVCSDPDGPEGSKPFRFAKPCPADSVNSLWLREALAEALERSAAEGYARPRRLRCWRQSMRTMVARGAAALGIELLASRRCYALIDWLEERTQTVYAREEGFLSGPLAAPLQPVAAAAVPLPEAARGERWDWASLPLAALAEAGQWDCGFRALLPLPAASGREDVPVPGIRLFAAERALAVAGWIAGLEPVRLDASGNQLVLDAGIEDRWLLGRLAEREGAAAREALLQARQRLGGLQFLAVQASPEERQFAGFWLLRDQPLA
ncbi:MAG: DUF1092 family protein [Aphanocapsa feldmannii 277cV]|uniref:DUF1092 family protein n=1 Tax=Aphanocapsa feldmannii 277cV TaxID=2507553 RepID=A0A524RNX6_9CHRO|nr:MAG: DUF1092 family protein [Aphanocapsa feldmannii 288cV]TGG93043.1 MAG: DUF1092 family protein [Aphanocapsa feldmannii 277cV]